LLFFFVAFDSGTLQYLLLIHHIILFAKHFFGTFDLPLRSF
jgi:hypothetical protein